MCTCTVVARKRVWSSQSGFSWTSTLAHIARIGLEWVLGWFQRKNSVFALTRRVRALDQLWYLSTSKTIFTTLKIPFNQKIQSNLLGARSIWLFGWRILYTFVSMNCFVRGVSVSWGRFTWTRYPIINPNLFFHIGYSSLQEETQGKIFLYMPRWVTRMYMINSWQTPGRRGQMSWSG